MPLSMMAEGSRAIVTAIQGGHGLNRRLAEMGVFVNSEIALIRTGGGPVVVEVRGSRLAIGRGMAQRVMVRPVM